MKRPSKRNFKLTFTVFSVHFFRFITSVVMITGLFSSNIFAQSKILRLGDHLDFGSVGVGTSITKTLMLYNDGDSNLTVSGIHFHERIADSFSGNFSGVIPPNGSQSVTITFTPADGKSYAGLVYVDSDRTNLNRERSRAMTATGLANVHNDVSRILTFSKHLKFGNVEVGQSVTKNLTLYNTGNSDLTVNGIHFHERIDGIYSGNFVGVIPAGGSEVVAITFTPLEDKNYNGLLYVDSDRTNLNKERSRSLDGTGFYGAPTNIVCTKILTFGHHIEFGDVAIGNSETKDLVIKNDGICDLTIDGLTFHKSTEGVYSATFSGVIAPGHSQSIPVTFTPEAVKEYSGLIYVNSDKTNDKERSRFLTGNGI